MKVAFLFAGGREARWPAARAGRGPTDFFYGAVELAREGRDITCVDAPEALRSPFAAVGNRLFDGRQPVRTRAEHVLAVGRVLPRLRRADVVVAASTSHANAVAFWQRRRLFSGRIIGIHCGLVNYPITGARQRATARAMRDQEIVLFADAERAETIRQCGVDPARVHANAFGVDARFWTPAAASREEFVLAVGNDGRRDYATLVEAVRDLPVPVKIVTTRSLPPLPPHVENLRGSWHAPAVTDDELRDLYRRALVVVVPLEDSLQPSGQSVALQAMACGRPVVLTRTRGQWTGDDYREGRELLLVEPGSPAALRAALQRLLGAAALRAQLGAAARVAVERHGRIEAFAARLGALF